MTGPIDHGAGGPIHRHVAAVPNDKGEPQNWSQIAPGPTGATGHRGPGQNAQGCPAARFPGPPGSTDSPKTRNSGENATTGGAPGRGLSAAPIYDEISFRLLSDRT